MPKKLLRWISLFIFAFICGMFFFGADGYAYVDPSVVTYLIQAIAGILVAIGAASGIYFRRFRRVIYKWFNIDENRNKEVESDDIEVYY